MAHSPAPNTVGRQFFRYVSQNILGMMGMSAYILADTYFIAQAAGADGITALNLILPVYSLIFAIGALLGIGCSTRFNLSRSAGDRDADRHFTNALFFCLLFGLLFLAAGLLFPDPILTLLGADTHIRMVGRNYLRICMSFAPFFMMNYVFSGFVRNDGDPSLAMAATLSSSLFNIVADYILMFPMGLGLTGAALATAWSPLVGSAICALHFRSGKNTIRLRLFPPSLSRMLHGAKLGVSAFIGELANGISTYVFNLLLLQLSGNVAVAAFGIAANTAIVATAAFNGVANGSQPLFSQSYGRGQKKELAQLLRLAVTTGFAIAFLLLFITNVFPAQIVALFNSEHDPLLAQIAEPGLRLYFAGFFFAGFNIVGTGYLSAIDRPGWAFASSILRGVVAILFCAYTLAALLGVTGVWLAFPAAEFITAVVTVLAIWKSWGTI